MLQRSVPYGARAAREDAKRWAGVSPQDRLKTSKIPYMYNSLMQLAATAAAEVVPGSDETGGESMPAGLCTRPYEDAYGKKFREERTWRVLQFDVSR